MFPIVRNLHIIFLFFFFFGLQSFPERVYATFPTPDIKSIQSYLAGGSGNDYVTEIIMLDEDHLLIAGNTTSNQFQGVEDVKKIGNISKSNIYIALVSLSRSKITRLLMIGGSDNDFLNAMSRGPSGEIYLCGNTFSKDFPAQVKFGNPLTNKKTNAFLLKINPELDDSIQSIIFGGSEYDYPSAMAINSQRVYIGGNTASIDFPVSQHAFNATLNSTTPGKNSYGFDTFIIAFNLDLTATDEATFLGGEADEFIRAMQFSEDDKLVVSGFTLSTDFYQSKGIKATPPNSFGLGAFITIVNPNMSEIIDSLILGTTNHLYVQDMALDPDGSFWLTGYCTDGNLPTKGKVIANRYKGGGYDSFIAHISKDMESVTATYLGGSNNEFAQKILVTDQGNVLVGGFTDSFHDFPITHNGNHTLNLGHYDIFTTELSRDLSSVHFSLLNGGSGYDYLFDMVQSKGTIYLSGHSTSLNLSSMELNKKSLKKKHNNAYINIIPLREIR